MEDSSLEHVETVAIDDSSDANSLNNAPQPPVNSKPPKPFRSFPHINWRVVIIIFAFLLLSGIAANVAISRKKTNSTTKTINVTTQTLDNGTLTKLSKQLGRNGEVNQQLTITPSTLFKSDVTVQGSNTINGDLFVKGSSTLLGPVATGSNLSVGGGLSVARNASIGGSLSVSGSITAGSLNVGSINLTNLSLAGNITVGGHIISTGTQPTVRASVAAGNGSASIAGNDTSGVVTINTGNGEVLAGELAVINFRTTYGLAPRILLTPVNPESAQLSYYVTEAAQLFTIDTATVPAKNTQYKFNYLVVQ